MTETYEVPHSTEAEEWVIGSVLKRASAMAGVQSLPPEDFYDRRYQAIWRAMLDLWNRAIPIDYGTLSTRLKGDDLAAAKVGMIELSDIDLHVPSAAHIQHYANIVTDTATQRRYISAAQKIAEAAYRPGCEISELMSQSEALLSSARPSDHRRDLLEPEQWAQALTDDLMMRQEGGRTAVLTGLHDLDLMTLGLDAGRLYLLMGIPGHGKALAIDTPLPTPDGWTTMGRVSVGDIVFDDRGQPCRVTHISGVQFDRPCWEVEFSDGSVIVADSSHSWLTQTDAERKYLCTRAAITTTQRSAARRLPTSGIRTTDEIAATLHRTDGGANHSIALAGALELPDADLPIDPYALGAWLGDGSSSRASIFAADKDAGIIGHVSAVGYEVREHRYGPQANGFAEYSIVGGFHASLRQLGLYEAKHIPVLYQRSSVRQRTALLQGLMDTDGYCSKTGTCEFTSTRERLAQDVFELVAALGLKPSIRMKPCNGHRPETSIVYTIAFTTDAPVFRLERKLQRQVSTPRATQRLRYIVDVRPTASVPVQCIQVDSPSHLFLAGRSCIATHNSELALQIAIHVALNSGPVLFASLEMTDVELAQRYVRITRGVDRNRLAITVGRNGLTPDDWTLVAAALAEMTSGRLWPASPRGQYTTADLRSDATAVQAKSGKIALIVADYVQRFRDRSGKYSSREENVALIAQNLKSLAREFGCPVLAPVQPNRDYKGRLSNPRPVLTDLRESGSLEGEADVVLGLYRDEKHNEESRDRGIMEVHMLKNRSGAGDEMGCRKLVWRGHRYDNYAALPTGAMVA